MASRGQLRGFINDLLAQVSFVALVATGDLIIRNQYAADMLRFQVLCWAQTMGGGGKDKTAIRIASVYMAGRDLP